jgi:hypothetical protein
MASTAFFTEKQLAGILGAAGRALNECNIELITLAALASEAYIGRLGVNVGIETVTEFLPMKGQGVGGGNDVFLGYANSRVTFSEANAGSENGMIVLNRTPVRTITSVNENLNAWADPQNDSEVVGGTWPTETLLEAGQYVPDWKTSGVCQTGILYRRYGAWPVEARTVRVIYAGGWSITEVKARYPELLPALRYAIMQWLAREHVAKEMAAGLTAGSYSLEDFSFSSGSGSLSSSSVSGAMAGGLPPIVFPADVLMTLSGEANLSKYLDI